jgi:sulfite exporter TauE/SafE
MLDLLQDFALIADMLASFCGSLPWSGSLLVGLFLAGGAGSVMHCVPMCGGFVLGQVADRMARLPAAHLCEWRRIGGGALLPYHLGRLTTYAGLGALAGSMLGWLPQFALVSAVLLTVAAALFIAQATRRLLPGLLPRLDHAPAAWTRAIGWLARRTGGDGYALGLVLGFLPCGFLYAALATAAASGNAYFGALGMLAFGLGTAPALIAVGIAGQAAGRRWQRSITVAAPAVMLLNAGLLLVLAVRTVA